MDTMSQAPEDRSVLGRNAKRTAPEELSLRKLDLFEVPSEMQIRTYMVKGVVCVLINTVVNYII